METFKSQTTPIVYKLDRIGGPERGFISLVNDYDIGFPIRRVYWIYDNPKGLVRGHHAHRTLQQVLVAFSGSVKITTENTSGDKEKFILSNPSMVLFIPPLHWRWIDFSPNASLLCLASDEYNESDYIRDYTKFKSLSNEV